MCVPAPGIGREMGGRSLSTHTQSYHSGWMFPIKRLNQPPNDSFHRHLGNYRSLLFTSGDRTAASGGGGLFAWQCKDWAASEGMQNKETGVKMKEGMK